MMKKPSRPERRGVGAGQVERAACGRRPPGVTASARPPISAGGDRHERRGRRRSRARRELGLAFLGLERAGAIDERAARLQAARRRGRSCGPAGRRGAATSLRPLQPGDVGVAADGAGRGAGRVEEDGVERLRRASSRGRRRRRSRRRGRGARGWRRGAASRSARNVDGGDAGAGLRRAPRSCRRARRRDRRRACRRRRRGAARAARRRRPAPTMRLRRSRAASSTGPEATRRTEPVGSTMPPSRSAQLAGSRLDGEVEAGSTRWASAMRAGGRPRRRSRPSASTASRACRGAAAVEPGEDRVALARRGGGARRWRGP